MSSGTFLDGWRVRGVTVGAGASLVLPIAMWLRKDLALIIAKQFKVVKVRRQRGLGRRRRSVVRHRSSEVRLQVNLNQTN